MKLSKLYCNKSFHNITFITEKGGLNVILGEAKGKQEGSNSHCLGKTKLAELLDFMLLKGHKDVFMFKSSNKGNFIGYEFYLELLLNNGKYLTIKRTTDDRTATKISFKLNNTISEGYILYETFDEVLAFDKAKKYLNDLLDFNFCKETNENYRRLVNYSLRLQGDYEPTMNTVFQLKKFTKNKDKDWKPLLFTLLGFNGEILKKKYEIEENIKEENKTIKAQEKDFGIKTEEKDLLVGKIQNAEIERENLSKELENLNFYQQDKKTIDILVGTIEEGIAEYNTLLYNLDYEIKKLENSIKNEFSFDLKRVQNIFDEVKLYFPEQLAKSYEQLINFNHQITQERNTQIQKTLQEKKQEEREVNSKLIDLNKQREQFRNLIQDTSLFKKYSFYQKNLIEIEKKLSRFQMQLETIEEIERKKEHIEETENKELQEVRNQLKDILDNTATCILYKNIRLSFSEIVKRILNEEANISITHTASTYNVGFKPYFPNSAQDEGATYYKILCVAFDLAVLINYRDKSHFRFVYHDDVISGDDNGIKSKLIDVVREICEKYDIQYVFSAIKDNMPPSQDVEKNIVLRLHDRDESGKLFKMNF
jgi:uncharacterized protein YydD (DUF2326 family)